MSPDKLISTNGGGFVIGYLPLDTRDFPAYEALSHREVTWLPYPVR